MSNNGVASDQRRASLRKLFCIFLYRRGMKIFLRNYFHRARNCLRWERQKKYQVIHPCGVGGIFISPYGRFVLFLEPSAKPNFHLMFHLIFIETKIFNLQVLLRSRDEKKFYVIKQGNAKQGQVWSAIDAIRSLAALTIANENSRESEKWNRAFIQRLFIGNRHKSLGSQFPVSAFLATLLCNH